MPTLSQTELTTAADLAALPELLAPLREQLLSNIVMLSQIPAPSGSEEERVAYVLDRFVEQQLPEAAADEFGNAVGRLPGRTGERTLIVVAHLDTIVPTSVDHNVTVQSDRLVGAGISDNSLGAAVMSMLPRCLAAAGIQLESDLMLAGSVKSLERANHEGLRGLLDNLNTPIEAALCVEGISLGRLNYFSIATIRGDIATDVAPQEVSRSYGSESAVVVLNHIINRLLSIEVPQRPFTRIAINRVRAGVSYDTEPTHAELSFEINSHEDAMIERLEREIDDLVVEVGSRHAVDAALDVFFERRAGGLPFSHPLVRGTHEAMVTLGIKPDRGHSPSELSEFLSRDIPALTLGLSTGEKHRRRPDHVLIEPILRGVAQVIAALLVADAGVSVSDAETP